MKKDFQNVLFSFGAVFVTLSVGAYVYYAQPQLPEDLNATGALDVDSMDDWTLTQTEDDMTISTVSSSTEMLQTATTSPEPVVPVPVPVKTTNTQTDAIAKQLADQKAAQEKAAADALAAKLAAEKLVAEKAAADALAAKLAAEKLAAEKAAADAAAKKSRKSRAS